MILDKVNKLTDEIISKRKEYLKSRIQRYRPTAFRASNIGDCDRQIVYSYLDWEKSKLHDEGLQAIFDRGNEEERIITRDLLGLGFNFMASQMPIEIKNRAGETICTGHIDGKIIYDGEAIPVEFKSTNMNTFNSIKSIDDLVKKPLHRKYLRQIQLYLFGNNIEGGLFIFSNLQGAYKIIPVTLDLGECEYILQRLERNWEMAKKKEYPKPIDYSEKICGKCPFAHLCLQPVENTSAQFIENEALEEKLTRREELKELVDEYESLDEEVKGTFRNIPQVFVGKSWQITGKESISKRVDTKALPQEIKDKYSVESTTWRTSIIKL